MFRIPSIPTRIFLGFALLSSLIVGLGVVSLRMHENAAGSLRRLHEGYLPLALTIGESKANQAVFVTLLDDLLDQSSGSLERDWIGIARRSRPATLRRATHGAERLARLAETEDERLVADHIIASLEVVRGKFETSSRTIDVVLEALRVNDRALAARELTRVKTLEVDAQRRLRELHILLEDRAASVARSAAEQEARAAVVIGSFTMVAVLLGLFVTWLAYRLLAPLPLLHERVGAVARGEFSNALTPRRDDELGRLTSEFERMVSALSARDRTLREAASQLERLKRMQDEIVAGLRSAVVVIDGDDRVRATNPAAERILGVATTDLGAAVGVAGALSRITELPTVLAEVRGSARVSTRSGVALDADRRIDLRASPFSEVESAGRDAVLLVVDDVTEELSTKARLVSTERLAAIGRMAAHVTHEVRNPLSSIALNVEMLGDELTADATEAHALIAAIQREIDRLTALTEEYLRLARVPEPRLELLDLADLLEDVARFVQPEMERASVRLTLDVPTGPVMASVDEAQLRQAALNLLRNAREAMPGGGSIVVSLAESPTEVVLRFADDGVGLDAAQRDKVFDAFYSTKAQGTGLGLALTQQVVASHGGSITIESRAPRGTVFVLRLPKQPASDKSPSA